MDEVWVDSVLGSDANSGTEGSPFLTIDEAFDNVNDDGTVWVVPNGSSNTYAFESGGAPAGITVKSTSQLIDRPGTDKAYWDGGSAVRQISTSGSITIQDMVIQNVNSNSGGSPFKYPDVAGTTEIVFNNCVIDSLLNAVSTGGRGGFVGNGNSVSLSNPTRINVRFNTCRISNFDGLTDSSGIVHETYGIVKAFFNDCTFFVPSGMDGRKIVASYSTSDLVPEFTNCIIRNEGDSDLGIFMRYSNTTGRGGAILDHCNYTGEDATEMALNTTTDCTTVNPQLRDPSAGDFNLEADSPIYGTGKLV